MALSLDRVARHIGELQLKLLQAEQENEELAKAILAKEDEVDEGQPDRGQGAEGSGSPGD